MKIEQVIGREIFDSRGLPTIECEIILKDGTFTTASVPCGASRGAYEAAELRDGGKRLLGLGVNKAIDKLENIIGPELIGKEPDIVEMDAMMVDLDGTDTKSKLGANTIIAASMAIVKAQAIVSGVETYELIAHLTGAESVALPFPYFNLINGGVHGNNKGLQIQEFMVVPMTAQNFRTSMEGVVVIYQVLRELLQAKGKSIGVGDEGGFCAAFKNEKEALDLLTEAMQRAKVGDYVIGLDIAASQFYNAKTGLYTWKGKELVADELIEYYGSLIEQYPIYSIEDGLADRDWDSWVKFQQQYGDKIQIVGDDLFATNPERIAHGIEVGAARCAVIKPNQIGTVTETLQAIILCKDHGMNTMVSHRSGETEDTFIVDLAVGTSAGQIKAGACCRGERIAKYNQMLRIEDSLLLSLL